MGDSLLTFARYHGHPLLFYLNPLLMGDSLLSRYLNPLLMGDSLLTVIKHNTRVVELMGISIPFSWGTHFSPTAQVSFSDETAVHLNPLLMGDSLLDRKST